MEFINELVDFLGSFHKITTKGAGIIPFLFAFCLFYPSVHMFPDSIKTISVSSVEPRQILSLF
jgi:hypothetical protein